MFETRRIVLVQAGLNSMAFDRTAPVLVCGTAKKGHYYYTMRQYILGTYLSVAKMISIVGRMMRLREKPITAIFTSNNHNGLKQTENCIGDSHSAPPYPQNANGYRVDGFMNG